MRGSDQQNGLLFSYVNLEERVPARHPLRKIKAGARPSGRSAKPCCAASIACAQFTLMMAAYNLAKLPRLLVA